MDFILPLLPAAEQFHTIGYCVAFFAALLETIVGIGLFVPGSTIILLMGILSAKGYFDLGDLVLFAIIGAIIGDNINYSLGKKYGSQFSSKGFWFIKPDHFRKGERYFDRNGPKSIFIGRFIPGIKEVLPLIAGTLGMKRLPFMFWDILGATSWSLAWILPGYFFIQSFDIAQTWLTRAGFFLVIILAVFITLYILKFILIKKGKKIFSFLSSLWQSIKQALTENPEVQKLTNKHKTFFQFIEKRLNKNKFSGLPLTVLSLALLYVLSLFGGVVEDIINSDIIISADIRVSNLLAIFRNEKLTRIFLWITLLGKWQVIVIFTIAAITTLLLWRKRSYIIPLLLSAVGSEIFTFIGKSVFHRERPNVAIYIENSFSFPSGHATIAVAFYGFISYIFIRNIRQWSNKINTFFTGFVLILLIGFSRLYLGVHYVSDVWGGYLAGAIWLIIAISLSEYLLYNKKRNRILYVNTKNKLTTNRLATVGIILTSIAAYIFFAFNYQIPTLAPEKETNTITLTHAMDIFTTDQLKYTETLLGDRQEPLSFIILAKNEDQLINLFKQAGWKLADEVTVANVIKLAKASLWKKSYPRAPMTPDFWDSEVHDYGFEKETKESNVRTRHHARFWKTNYITKNGYIVFVGTASFDNSIKWGLTHKIDPDIDTEREFLFHELHGTNLITHIVKQQFVKPRIGSNFSGDLFFTDGKLYLLST